MLINEVTQRKDIPLQYMYKCVFIMGSPASGKSTFAEKRILPPEFRIEDLDNVMNWLKFKEYNKSNTSTAWNKMQQRRRYWTDEGLPIASVTTGKDINRTIEDANRFKQAGYDVFGLYVFTELQTAINRALEREKHAEKKRDQRKTDPEYIEYVWGILANTRNQLSSEFKGSFSGFTMALNTDWIDPFNRINDIAVRDLNKFINKPLTNPIGLEKLRGQEAFGK